MNNSDLLTFEEEIVMRKIREGDNFMAVAELYERLGTNTSNEYHKFVRTHRYTKTILRKLVLKAYITRYTDGIDSFYRVTHKGLLALLRIDTIRKQYSL